MALTFKDAVKVPQGETHVSFLHSGVAGSWFWKFAYPILLTIILYGTYCDLHPTEHDFTLGGVPVGVFLSLAMICLAVVGRGDRLGPWLILRTNEVVVPKLGPFSEVVQPEETIRYSDIFCILVQRHTVHTTRTAVRMMVFQLLTKDKVAAFLKDQNEGTYLQRLLDYPLPDLNGIFKQGGIASSFHHGSDDIQKLLVLMSQGHSLKVLIRDEPDDGFFKHEYPTHVIYTIENGVQK